MWSMCICISVSIKYERNDRMLLAVANPILDRARKTNSSATLWPHTN